MRPVNLIPAEERRGDAAKSRTGPLAYVLVGVLFAVDADGIVAKEDRFDLFVQTGVLASKSVPVIGRHRPIVARVANRRLPEGS